MVVWVVDLDEFHVAVLRVWTIFLDFEDIVGSGVFSLRPAIWIQSVLHRGVVTTRDVDMVGDEEPFGNARKHLLCVVRGELRNGEG